MNKMAATLTAVCVICTLLVGLAGCAPEGEITGPDSGIETEGENGGNGTETPAPPEEAHECSFPEGLVLPQVFIMGRFYYTREDLDALQSNVIEPLISYCTSQGYTAVSIKIENDNPGGSEKNYFLVSLIASKNDGTRDPIYMGFIHYKVDGRIPVWEMETI